MCNLKKSKVNFLYSLYTTVLSMALQTSTSQARFPYESHSLWQISSLFFSNPSCLQAEISKQAPVPGVFV